MYVLLILIELKCLMVSKRAYWIKLILINSNSFFDSLLWIPKSVFVFLSVYIKIKPCFKQIKTLYFLSKWMLFYFKVRCRYYFILQLWKLYVVIHHFTGIVLQYKVIIHLFSFLIGISKTRLTKPRNIQLEKGVSGSVWIYFRIFMIIFKAM